MSLEFEWGFNYFNPFITAKNFRCFFYSIVEEVKIFLRYAIEIFQIVEDSSTFENGAFGDNIKNTFSGIGQSACSFCNVKHLG